MSVVYEKLRAASTAGNATGTLPSPNRFQLAQSGISGEQEDKRDYLAAASDGSEAALQDYLRKHPQGAYAQDVRDRIAALTGVKPTAPSTERGNLLILPGEPELLFEAPLRTGPYPVNGKSLQELAKGSPLFSPIEGLPDEVWKGKKCTNCHHWDKVTLCDQGTVYARNEPAHMLRKQHPYGGPFKLALRNWAEAGCK